MKKNINRRKLLGYGAGTIAGVQLLQWGGSLLHRHGLAGKLRAALAANNREALAKAMQVSSTPVIQICLIDKIQQAMLFRTPGTIGEGDLNGLDGQGLTYNGEDISGQALPENIVNFRGIEMTQLFGGRLAAGLADGYNLAILPQFTSQAGGHSLQNTDLDMDKGGLNYTIEAKGQGTGLLGYVGFDIGADANDSRESAVGSGRVPLPTYDSVGQIRDTHVIQWHR